MTLQIRASATLGACLLLFSSPGSGGQPADFEAMLELHRNGKLTGQMEFRLSSGDGRWTMQSKTEGTKGLASWIGLRESSTSEGDWAENRPRPMRTERTVKAIKTMRWQSEFDWEKQVVHTVYPDGESFLELEPGVLDEESVGLAIRQGLRQGENEWFFREVDEDEIDDVHFRVNSVEDIQTPLGCIRVHVVEKVRAPTSKRYTRTYYAADHDFVPVRLEHGKTGKEHIEGWVTLLSVAGQQVAAGPDCPR